MKSHTFPDFDHPVPESGYQWWYVDGTSDDGEHHIVMIAFVGSVFSPHYFRAIGNGDANPENYCALNLGVYSKGQRRWVLTEYDQRYIERGARHFTLGNNRLNFDGDTLQIEVHDQAVPWPRAVRGRIRVTPHTQTRQPFTLHQEGEQRWWPFAPSAHVEVNLSAPSLSWNGEGYFDTNSGALPLQDCFLDWHWSRRHHHGATHINYQTRDDEGKLASLALRIAGDGNVTQEEPPRLQALPRALWRMPRPIATDATPQLVATLEDAPFYTRSVVATPGDGPSLTMHESLSLEQFTKPWVQRLLPFRTRR